MKSLNWPQVVLVGVLLAAVILSHVFAPLSVSVVTSIVSTIVGAVFIDLKRKEAAKAPVLTLVRPGEEKEEES